MCLQGASRAGAGLLEAMPDADVLVYCAWAPMLPPDDEAAARLTAERFAERRAQHYWDGERHLARRMGRALAITAKESIGLGEGPGLAWDVYLAYGRGRTDIERPDFWMHQLGVKHAPRLDPAAWVAQIGKMSQSEG